MALVKHKTVKQALDYVAANPDWSGGSYMESPTWENIARTLYKIGISGDSRVVGSINRGLKAQKIILNRQSGTRRAGTTPAVKGDNKVTLKDLTGGSDE